MHTVQLQNARIYLDQQNVVEIEQHRARQFHAYYPGRFGAAHAVAACAGASRCSALVRTTAPVRTGTDSKRAEGWLEAGCTRLRPATGATLVVSVYGISSVAPTASQTVFLDKMLLIQINPRVLQLHCVHRNDRRRED